MDLDEVVQRALSLEVEEPLTSPAMVAEALAEVGVPPRWGAPTPNRPLPWRAMGIALIAMLFLAGLVLVGWQFWLDRDRAPAGTAATSSPSATPSPSEPTEPAETPLPVTRAVAFDPAGDGEENDEDAKLAIDGDPATAWRTLTYATRELGDLKPGVGLELRLSGSQPVAGIDLELVGRGTDVQIWAKRPEGSDTGKAGNGPLAGYQKLASVRGAGDQATWRFAPAVDTRSVVIWLTALPTSEPGYRGGIAEVLLLS
jgi:hypothetical protein